MALSYVASSVSGSGTSTNRTTTAPTGAADDDILRAYVYIESTGTVTPPAGWSNTFNGTTMSIACATAGAAFTLKVYWIRRSGAPGLTWTWTGSPWNHIHISAWRGAVTSGDPFSFGALTARDTTASRTFADISGTTLDANEYLEFFGACFDSGGTGTQPTGFTETIDVASTGGAEMAYLLQASAGSTGTVTGGSYSAGNASTTISCLSSLRPDTGAVVGQPRIIRGAGVPGMRNSGRQGGW